MTSVEVAGTERAMSFVVPTMASGELGADMIPEIVRGGLLTLDCGEVVVSPEWDGVREAPEVKIVPLEKDEGDDVLTSVMVPAGGGLVVSMFSV